MNENSLKCVLCNALPLVEWREFNVRILLTNLYASLRSYIVFIFIFNMIISWRILIIFKVFVYCFICELVQRYFIHSKRKLAEGCAYYCASNLFKWREFYVRVLLTNLYASLRSCIGFVFIIQHDNLMKKFHCNYINLQFYT